MTQPSEIDLTPPEDFLERSTDFVLYLHENFARLQLITTTPLFHNVAAATFTISDNKAGLNCHIVHITQTGAVTINLPSNSNDGELFFCKDAAGDAGSSAKTIQVTGATGQVEGAANQQITTNNGWLLLYGYNGNYHKLG